MRLRYRFIAQLAVALAIVAAVIGLVRYAAHKNFPIIDDVLGDAVYGKITVARPLISFQSLAMIFADGKTFPAAALAARIAKTGVAVAVIDTGGALQALTGGGTHCLEAERIGEPLAILAKWAHAPEDTTSIVAGIGAGSLLPFLAAAARPDSASQNLSVNFSVNLPDKMDVCAPLSSKLIDGHRELTSSPALQGKWLGVWTDEPEQDTALFVRGLLGAKTDIAPYDTPLDTVTVNEIQKLTAEALRKQADPVPTVALPAKKPNGTVTLFYSGDGGWRDLDRSVGGLMAERGYPVVGVDALRYFWSSKSAARVAGDLSGLMKHYRSAWKAEHFVLAGYSFGADILPAVYNHLPESDRKDVDLLVLLALGKTADFEIHVSGWIGKSTGGFPILPELKKIPGKKILCIYGKEEKDDSACSELSAPDARILELPGGHHFDNDYPKLTMRLINVYQQIGMKGSN
jgi:type IV secretory pathway VirJ component